MAEKEERIEQFITIQQRTITTRDYETNDEIISKIYTRQEAIKEMARAICNHRVGECPEKEYHCDNCWADSSSYLAEVVLNALLEKGEEK